ncbi:MAG: ribosomal RNA small subunit methyltransferase A, partial [Pseudomonadota bacterium]|nr:ribosomal RNA small subunit methyltransferase A [Pseudomonadota bacterium]
DFSHYGQRLRIIGNLPYNISTPLLFHLAQFRAQIQDLHFMLQKEVIDRMIANPGTTAFGRLSVMLQYWFTMEKLLEVPAEAFHPKPKVESAIIRMVPKLTIPSAINESELSCLVKAAFSQRRKTLRNTLKGTINPVLFSQAEIDSGLRAEDLSVSDYVRLANLLTTSQNRN